ncbi:unnamed protein product [Ectocarpus sp. CCAP 1310/34]|nr:unnamed protein product [Ectocarpus sp. CCAP 1310/34]
MTDMGGVSLILGMQVTRSYEEGTLTVAQNNCIKTATLFGTKTQSLTAQSTVESELQGNSYATREAVYLSNLLMEFKFDIFKPIPICSDSSGALSLAANSMFSSRTTHIALRFFFLRELIKRRRITVKHLDRNKSISILEQIEDFGC